MNSSQLKSYLTGLILGDGYIDNGIQKRAFRIKSINIDFIQKIYNDLSSATNFKININQYYEHTDKNNVHHKYCEELCIKSHPYFSKIYHYFYDDFRKRIISKKSLNSLDWNGWANWFMSDGYIVKIGKESGNIVDRRVELCTDRYSYHNVKLLSQHLQEKYGYKIKIVKRNKGYRIRFSLLNAQDFLSNIFPFVVPSFFYKINMGYNYRPTWMNDEYYKIMTNIQSTSLFSKKDEEIV